jgi:glycosyltransferase involved in cell wall biosynthesis
VKTASFNPKVSIVIPVYNGSNYLKAAIDSALDQTYQNIEVIVINDGSTDNGSTDKVATSYGDRIRYYKKANGGVASALNFGIAKMTGSYFSWLSHDDMYKKTKIEAQVGCLNKTAIKKVIVAANVKVLFDSGIKKKENIDANTFAFIDIFLATSAIVGLNGCSLLIPKEAFEECGNFDVNLPVTQDYDLWFRMKDKYQFVLLNKHLVISRRHAEQDSVRKQKFLYEAADAMHSNFLKTISYERFVEYFKANRKNFEHTYKNYLTYKSRGYQKTSKTLLEFMLRYLRENDKQMFHKLSITEKNATYKDEESQSAKAGWHNRLAYSVKHDGVYLTTEKAIRKIYTKATKKRR